MATASNSIMETMHTIRKSTSKATDTTVMTTPRNKEAIMEEKATMMKRKLDPQLLASSYHS